MRLLAEKLVELRIVDKVSAMTVQRAQKNELRPNLSKYWKIPREHDAGFVSRMEDILDVYARPYNSQRPVVCMDESSQRLIGEVRQPLPTRPGKDRKVDDEFVRDGVAEIFLAIEPLGGKRSVSITQRRRRDEWADFVKHLVNDCYPAAEQIVLIIDNLNTHDIASLYQRFDPEEAPRIREKLEIHFTPKHGSLLNIAEIELSALKSQCLSVRIATLREMQDKVADWENSHNNREYQIDWQFTTSDALIKLKHLYPVLDPKN